MNILSLSPVNIGKINRARIKDKNVLKILLSGDLRPFDRFNKEKGEGKVNPAFIHALMEFISGNEYIISSLSQDTISNIKETIEYGENTPPVEIIGYKIVLDALMEATGI